MARAVPLGSTTVGPISATIPGQVCGSVDGVEPAETHVFDDGRYFSAFGIEVQSTASTVSSGSSTKDSSAHRSLLFGPALNAPAAGSKNAVWELLMFPISARPSVSRQSGASPTLVQ